eukprot:COSAG01_NODE_29421_length_638_cov_0.729128_2_plen_25_part_01
METALQVTLLSKEGRPPDHTQRTGG